MELGNLFKKPENQSSEEANSEPEVKSEEVEEATGPTETELIHAKLEEARAGRLESEIPLDHKAYWDARDAVQRHVAKLDEALRK